MLPHQELWREVFGLVVDGARFTKATANTMMGKSGDQRGEYDAVGAATPAQRKNSSPAMAKKQVELDSPLKAVDDGKPLFGDDGDTGSDNDDVVE